MIVLQPVETKDNLPQWAEDDSVIFVIDESMTYMWHEDQWMPVMLPTPLRQPPRHISSPVYSSGGWGFTVGGHPVIP